MHGRGARAVPRGAAAWQAGAVGTPPEPVDAEVTLRAVPGSDLPMHAVDPAEAELEELVQQARGGDAAAFGELVRRTHAATFTLARRLVSDDDDARDVTQEAYLRAFRSIGRFRGDAQFTTWLYRITANCASTQLGKRRRHHHHDLDDDLDVVDDEPTRDPVAATDGALLRRHLEEAIAELPSRLRSVVVLRDVYDLSHAEIAEQLGISESAAKVRLHRARRRLRARVFPLAGEHDRLEVEEHARAV
jgi:RNA polymerase sigma-70 factor (ECF subfamily)